MVPHQRRYLLDTMVLETTWAFTHLALIDAVGRLIEAEEPGATDVSSSR